MKNFIVLATLVVLAAGKGTDKAEGDDLDVDTLIGNPVMLKVFFECAVDKGPCNKLQLSFKADLSLSIQQACRKCTAAKKAKLKKFFAGLKKKSPAEYEAFKKKFDPENKYFASFEKNIA